MSRAIAMDVNMRAAMRARFENDLYRLLMITAPSGYEAPVARFLVKRLTNVTDEMYTDAYGNLLGERCFGSGNGPTVLLCAHMDTVWVDPGRGISCRGDIWSSTSGPLGADDRAGIAVIITVMENLEEAGFNGKVKLAFTREEEIGRIGSNEIDPVWLGGADLAIVVDRRGSRDIVVRNGLMDFCDQEMADYFERTGARCGMPDWKAVRGGISDAMTFAKHGIPSVNLSAGYKDEHTEEETMNVEHGLDTVRFVLAAVTDYRP
ncbi:M20/M25/M40 family metallo-hydrolase [Paenibacillus sp. MBLB4367]|uniref:M20/M25/M40 family metallo-hydrolase n=1 Tax=Paenibacillus sp. MBLB4367 TaxID=3384767 RepID=UPI0039082898